MNNAIKRGVRTFLQAFIGGLVAAGVGFVDVAAWKTAAVSGGVALLSYIQNALEDSDTIPKVLK